MKERVEYIDATKAICMLLVVLGHCHWADSIPHLYGAIYSFHMPIFFIISGMFIKRMGINESIKKYGKAYIIPYLVTCLICIMAVTVLAALGVCPLTTSLKESVVRCAFGSGWDSGEAFLSTVPGVGPIWFLTSLFWACTFFSVIEYNVSSELRKVLIFVSLAALARLSISWIRLPLSIQSGLFSMIFIYAGSLIRKYDIVKRSAALPPAYLILILPICFFHVLKCNTILSTAKVDWDSLGVFTTLLVCCVIFFIVKRLGLKGGWLGRNTLAFLCAHSIIVFIGFYYSKLSFSELPFHPALNLAIEYSVNVVAAYVLARVLCLTPVFDKKK